MCNLDEDYGDSLGPSTLIQLCPLQTLHAEHRFWVVHGEVVTASTYKIGRRVIYQAVPHDHPAMAFVQARMDTWQPHEAFVVDVAETDRGMKVVEINTLNSSVFYAADIPRLVMALEHAATLEPWTAPKRQGAEPKNDSKPRPKP